MDVMLRYFRDQAVVRWTNVFIDTGTAKVILPADPQRYLISMFNDGTVATHIGFGADVIDYNETFQIPSGAGPVVLTEDVFGELIRLPVNAFCTGGSLGTTIITVSYCNYRWEQMRRYIDGCISQYKSL